MSVKDGYKMERIIHPFDPVFDDESKVLILGTMASPASRQAGFYYGYPQNRFWRIMGELFDEQTPQTRESRILFCHMHHIALWDVLQSCNIRGADDGSIRNPVPQPIEELLAQAPIRAIFTTGQRAQALYARYVLAHTGMKAALLPSTSPANCGCSYAVLLNAYRIILPFCAYFG